MNNDPDIPLTNGTFQSYTTISTAVPAPASQMGQKWIEPNQHGHATPFLSPLDPIQHPVDEANVHALEKHGFTKGLVDAMIRDKQAFSLRIWIIDNSGSMVCPDGHRLVETAQKHDIKFLPCSRWKEVQDTIDFHARLAALLKSPTEFRLLNDPGKASGPQHFSIAEHGDSYIDAELDIARSTVLNSHPHGVTPLINHVNAVRARIVSLEPTLLRLGTKVVVVIATDGLPSDSHGMSNHAIQQEFVDALRSLEGLPVWLVVRLCTDEAAIVNFYNDLDSQLEVSLEVLDDLRGEAKEVYSKNKWLTYSLPLQRMREMGFSNRVLDLLDERPLSKDELRDFFLVLFGDGCMDGVPDPESDWPGFVDRISALVENEQMQPNPISRKMESWVNMKRLRKQYGSGFRLFR